MLFDLFLCLFLVMLESQAAGEVSALFSKHAMCSAHTHYGKAVLRFTPRSGGPAQKQAMQQRRAALQRLLAELDRKAAQAREISLL